MATRPGDEGPEDLESRMAILLKTSRTQGDRLLSGASDITLSSLQRPAAMAGRRVTIELVKRMNRIVAMRRSKTQEQPFSRTPSCCMSNPVCQFTHAPSPLGVGQHTLLQPLGETVPHAVAIAAPPSCYTDFEPNRGPSTGRSCKCRM